MYENLLLDGLNIGMLTREDKEYLERFQECLVLSMNLGNLRSLQKKPVLP